MSQGPETTSADAPATDRELFDALLRIGIRTQRVDGGAGRTRMLMATAEGDPAARKLRAALSTLVDKPAEKFPKLDHVSFYTEPDKSGRPRYRLAFRVPGYRRRVDRLGLDGAKAYKWARHVSETIAAVKARMLKAEEAYRQLYVDRTPIETFVTEYARGLSTKGVTTQYKKTTLYRIRKCLDLADITRVDRLSKRIIPPLLEQLRELEAGPGKDRTIVEQTINAYVDDLRKFTRWLKKHDKISSDPLEHVEGVKVIEEKGRRRDATPEDIKWIYAAAVNEPEPKGSGKRRMPGADRGMLYLVAFCTGLRRKELYAADVSWLRLDDKEPKLILPDKFAKNDTRAEQPLPGWLATMLKKWLGKRAAGKLFPKMPRDIIKRFRADLAAARELWINEQGIDAEEKKRRQDSDVLKSKTSDGVLVFHSLRHGYASALLDGGADLKLAQFLTRHSSITLLADRYGHVRKNKVAAAVESALPNPVADVKVGEPK